MRGLKRLVPRISLRQKLLLVSLLLLAIPWVGYQYVREMEGFLRTGQESAVLGTARAVATVLNGRAELFDSQSPQAGGQPILYAHSLNRPIFLDGYGDDWEPLLSNAPAFTASAVDPGDASYRLLLGVYAGDLYLLLRVTDDRLLYPPPLFGGRGNGDQLYLNLPTPDGERRQYLISTSAPGWAGAYLLDRKDRPLRRESRIKAEWQGTENGYDVELRVPLDMVGSRLGLTLSDVDDADTGKAQWVGVARNAPAPLAMPSPELTAILRGLEQASARIWVVGKRRGVLALAGELREPEGDPLTVSDAVAQRNPLEGIMALIYSLILERPDDDFSDELTGAAYLDRPEVDAALAGRSETRWRGSAADGALLLSASHPVRNGDEVMGAVMVEQNSSAILTLQNRALETLFNVTLVVFLAATLGLLLFSSRLSARVRRLRNEAEAAIGPDGRFQSTEVQGTGAGDELGDLARSFNELLERLSQYTRYLETMASKLSHELRTPLAVVQSSLDNLDMTDLQDESRVYSTRAREGLLRLSTILQRMGEATRLEQALQHSERETIELTALIGECVAGYRSVYAGQAISAELPDVPLPVSGVSDLLVQLLDKLVANARDFAAPDTPIVIGLRRENANARLSVSNKGPPLPADMSGGLFDSMVSMRDERGDEPHLGLGLYIVRLIAQFHGGSVRAENLSDGSGVVFSVRLPLRGGDLN